MRPVLHDKSLWWALGFIVLMSIFLFFEQYFILTVPVILILIWLLFTRLDWVFFSLLFFTPVSLNIIELGVEKFGLFIPTEPIL